jgi:hypothetical protein
MQAVATAQAPDTPTVDDDTGEVPPPAIVPVDIAVDDSGAHAPASPCESPPLSRTESPGSSPSEPTAPTLNLVLALRQTEVGAPQGPVVTPDGPAEHAATPAPGTGTAGTAPKPLHQAISGAKRRAATFSDTHVYVRLSARARTYWSTHSFALHRVLVSLFWQQPTAAFNFHHTLG